MNPYCPTCNGLTDPAAQKWLNVPLCKCPPVQTFASDRTGNYGIERLSENQIDLPEQVSKLIAKHFWGLVVVCLFLSSCSPYIDTKHGIVSAGFMSSTQAFSGSMTSTDGTKVKWSVVGTDGTAVPIAVSNTIQSVGIAKYTFKGLDSTNNKDVSIGHQGVQNNAIKNPITTTTQAVDPVTGKILTNTAQSVPGIPK